MINILEFGSWFELMAVFSFAYIASTEFHETLSNRVFELPHELKVKIEEISERIKKLGDTIINMSLPEEVTKVMDAERDRIEALNELSTIGENYKNMQDRTEEIIENRQATVGFSAMCFVSGVFCLLVLLKGVLVVFTLNYVVWIESIFTLCAIYTCVIAFVYYLDWNEPENENLLYIKNNMIRKVHFLFMFIVLLAVSTVYYFFRVDYFDIVGGVNSSAFIVITKVWAISLPTFHFLMYFIRSYTWFRRGNNFNRSTMITIEGDLNEFEVKEYRDLQTLSNLQARSIAVVEPKEDGESLGRTNNGEKGATKETTTK